MKIHTPNDYTPLTPAAIKQVLQHDHETRHRPGTPKPTNRNRFYLYLTQSGPDIQIRCIAVKAPDQWSAPIAKEVSRASVSDPWIHILDLAYVHICGYIVDWTPQGFGTRAPWSYGNQWGSEIYSQRGPWKINAPVINPELLTRTRRFRYCAWKPANGHLLDYLKVYAEHPEIELLSKAGLTQMCTKTGLLNRLKKNADFRRFFMTHLDQIKSENITIDIINKAYAKKSTFNQARKMINARRNFRGNGLPTSICAMKATSYIRKQNCFSFQYTSYLKDCRTLGLDLNDTKVAFPKNFNERQAALRETIEAQKRKENAAERRRINKRINEIANEWNWLEKTRKTSPYIISLPRSDRDLIREGNALANCLKQPHYAQKIEKGRVIIFFIRKATSPNKSFIAVEYDIEKQLITQCYGKNNTRPPDEVTAFANRTLTKTKTLAA